MTKIQMMLDCPYSDGNCTNVRSLCRSVLWNVFISCRAIIIKNGIFIHLVCPRRPIHLNGVIIYCFDVINSSFQRVVATLYCRSKQFGYCPIPNSLCTPDFLNKNENSAFETTLFYQCVFSERIRFKGRWALACLIYNINSRYKLVLALIC